MSKVAATTRSASPPLGSAVDETNFIDNVAQ